MSKSEITVKSSKSEILEAYEEVLQALEEVKKSNKLEARREQEKRTTITNASQNTSNGIVQDLANLKLEIVKSLESVENQLLAEHKKLSTLQEALKLQENDLEDLHQIKMTVNTFEALLQAQKQKKEAFDRSMVEQTQVFEQEMVQKRLLWKQEQEQVTNAWKEQENQQKKLKQREEEDYIYRRDLERKKENDKYVMQQQALEKELIDKRILLEQEFAQREANVLAKEQELQSLRAQAEEAPKKLQQAIVDTEKAITERLHFKYDYEIKIAQKEVEGERKLYQQMIATLEAKIKQQEQQVKELTEKANHSGLQVQQIAVKAIESASGQRFYNQNPDKNVEVLKDEVRQRS
jgi:hypothetical protein